jgi:pimeloyl-ACP methyl ester carboxylesterase
VATTAAAAPPPRPLPEQTSLTWGPCEADVDPALECTTLPVPLDYANPSGATIDLALIRLPANPAARQGAVLFNPGGPGGSGYDWVAGTATTIAATMDGMDRFDLVGFDPRGVDRSGAIDCVSATTFDAALYPDDTPDTPIEEFFLDATNLVFPLSCRAKYGDALAQYSTANTARDMDRIREALGDQQISFVGISYGTYLGAVYATLFPDRVRAMVLDAAFEPTGDSIEEQWTTQKVGFEDAFANFAAWCEESADCEFTALDVAARWDALLARLDAQPIRSETGRVVNQNVMERATIAALYSELMWPALAAGLADAEAGDGTGLLDLADGYNGRRDDGSYDSIMQSFPVISCASGFGQDTPPDPTALLAQLRAAAPRFTRSIRIEDLRDTCLDLIPTPIEAIVPAYSGPAPILVVGGLNDPATPYRWSEELTAAMGPSARLLAYNGEGHGQILNSTCVTDIQAAVIANLQLPAPGSRCEADPPFAQPSFWPQLPVPAGVGPVVDDAMIAAVLGLPDTQYFWSAWALTGDPAAVAASYGTSLPELGLQVAPVNTGIIDGVSAVPAFAPDGTNVVVLIIPPAAIATNPDLADLADSVPPGQGLVVALAFASN